MKRLELEPLDGKKLHLFLIEHEFPVEWWAIPASRDDFDLFINLRFLSKEYLKFIDTTLNDLKLDYVVEEKGLRTKDEFLFDNPLIDAYKKYNLLHKAIDIPENVLNYITVSLQENRELVDGIKNQLKKLLDEDKRLKGREDYIEQILTRKEYLDSEYKNEEDKIRYEVRENWMMMKILDIANKIDKTDIKISFIGDRNHFEGIKKLSEELQIEITVIDAGRIIKPIDMDDNFKEILNKSNYKIIEAEEPQEKVEENDIQSFFEFE